MLGTVQMIYQYGICLVSLKQTEPAFPTKLAHFGSDAGPNCKKNSDSGRPDHAPLWRELAKLADFVEHQNKGVASARKQF